MKRRNAILLGGVALGLGLLGKSFLPQRFSTLTEYDIASQGVSALNTSALPVIDVTFLRCGSVTIPELVAVRGSFSLAPRVITHSAVLIWHPKGIFLYDTGLSTAIYTYLTNQSLLFRKTLANFTLEQSLSNHLKRLGLKVSDLNFALISHLHWDHVGGILDIPEISLYINRVEHDSAREGMFEANRGLIRDLMGSNPVKLFECTGPAYEGFRSSYDLFGDGSIVLVPLPGHTAGNTGMFVNRSNGSRLFLIGDAAWVSPNYARPATMHPLIWAGVTSDDATARQTLIQLHEYARHHPEIPVIAMHDAAMQERFMAGERATVEERIAQ